MTFSQWFRQLGSLVPMSWPESREKQDEELARAAWDAGRDSRNEEVSDLREELKCEERYAAKLGERLTKIATLADESDEE